MLKKDRRISKDRVFVRVMKNGKKFHSPNSIWFYLPHSDLKKVGFIVSNKVSLKASRRNRIKRRLRSLVKDSLEKLPNGYLVIMVKRDYSKKESFVKDFKNQFEKLIGHLG